ncbi:armadillo-type protein [Lipomyces japonicus]|uniref:armadillo-type protein n=1 Tax=Lipomyces japonicus TaxID=56871 RepID=UPI0034D00D6B
MSSSSSSLHENENEHILPASLLDDVVTLESRQQFQSSIVPSVGFSYFFPTSTGEQVMPLQIDSNIVNIAGSPAKVEREALLSHLDNQAKLIELQKQTLLTQPFVELAEYQDDNAFMPEIQSDATSEIARLRYELQNVQMKLNNIGVTDTQFSNTWALPIADDVFYSQPPPDHNRLSNRLPADYGPIGASIWQNVSGPTSEHSRYPQLPMGNNNLRSKNMDVLSQSFSFKSAQPLNLQTSSEKDGWPSQSGRKRNQGGNGSGGGSSSSGSGSIGTNWSPDYDMRHVSTAYGAIGTPLSVHSKEFIPGGPAVTANYIALTEPINYRHLLERSVNCNWKYIVDKIVNNNDQQASIFLQQKLKIGSADQKFAIIEAIVEQAYLLMVNRFGNFLVQRCFEHGTPEQIESIARAIQGNVLLLAMDAFGCHVVQKALDCVDERLKADMVMELLNRVSETVVHRYACHVWQKLFELSWKGQSPPIMAYVNKELKGMWTQVALGETGSLVVQNIFENCVEEDKRQCIEEVLKNLDEIARGQWGNWVIQHMVEHGAPNDMSRAVAIVIKNAVAYSTDQFASKVIEKLIKCGGPEVVDRYLEKLFEGRPDRPRIPLIDIASDAYGNYLIQYILLSSTKPQRDLVAAQIKKHMVSLRGSKWGSKCTWLVDRYKTQSVHVPSVTNGHSAEAVPSSLSSSSSLSSNEQQGHHGSHFNFRDARRPR